MKTTDHDMTIQELKAALDRYERVHSKWMDTPVHTARGKEVKKELDEAREEYLAAVRKAHPTWIIM